MKKKLSILMIALLVTLTMMPLSSVFAYSGGLLNGKTLNVSSNKDAINLTTNVLTDNDTSTTFDFASGNATNNDTAWFEFSEPVSINSYKLEALIQGMSIKFYDSNGVRIDNLPYSTVKYDGTQTNINTVHNVKKISLDNGTGSTISVKEFDVFGTVGATNENQFIGADFYKGNGGATLSMDLDDSLFSDGSTTAITNANVSSTVFLWAKLPQLKEITKIRYYSSGTGSLVFSSYKGTEGALTQINSTGTITPVAGWNTVYLSSTGTQYIGVNSTSGNSNNIYEMEIYTTSKTYQNISNLNANESHDSANITWTDPTQTDFDKVTVYENGIALADVNKGIQSYFLNGLTPSTTYTYVLKAHYTDGSYSSGQTVTFTTSATPLDITPTGEIQDLQVMTTQTTIDFTWQNPADPDFRTVYIYQDNQLIGTASNGQYSVTGLLPDTQYNFTFKAEDTSGNVTNGVGQTITTNKDVDLTAPSAPTGLSGDIASNGVSLKWNRNSETDIQGYNIYVDGIKDNATPITNVYYSLTGLDAGTAYSITITAVDSSGNESPVSTAFSVTPDPASMPILKMGYSLDDVAQGTGTWFNELWLIIAFAVAIPLSFYISNRIKLLFLG